jgi:hypothetical protein
MDLQSTPRPFLQLSAGLIRLCNSVPMCALHRFAPHRTPLAVLAQKTRGDRACGDLFQQRGSVTNLDVLCIPAIDSNMRKYPCQTERSQQEIREEEGDGPTSFCFTF